MIKLLSIGNSFSQDTQAYLHDMAAAGGISIKAGNLYIGGCSLQQHWENASGDHAAYSYEENGEETGRTVSIRQALQQDDWDIVTFQQASHDSGLPETYEPYLSKLTAYVRTLLPTAKQVLHQTWAYETDSGHPAFSQNYESNQKLMYERLCGCYKQEAARHHMPLIPCGTVIQHLRETKPFDYQHGGRSLCRDGFHMDIPYGRYAVSAVWFETLLNGDIGRNPYLPSAADPELIGFLKTEIHDFLSQKELL